MSKLFVCSVTASVLGHVAVSMMLKAAPSPPPVPAPSSVAFEVVAPPPRPVPAPLPRALPEPAVPAPVRPVAAPPPLRAVPARAPEVETSAPEPARVVDLTGVTLASDDGAFSIAAGNGEARRGPLNARRVASRARPPAPARPRPKAPPLVPPGDLSARPVAPRLDGALRASYPPAARAQGIGGSATVRVRISSAGIAGVVRVLSETHAGFGQACRRTVSGSRWSPPRDAAGRAVATEIVYRCRFVVDP